MLKLGDFGVWGSSCWPEEVRSLIYIVILHHVDHPDTPTDILGRVDGCDAGVVQKRGILLAVQTMSAVSMSAVSTGGSGRHQSMAQTVAGIYPVSCFLHFITSECHIVRYLLWSWFVSFMRGIGGESGMPAQSGR